VRTLFRDPKHPYTRGLLASLPGRHGTRLRAIEGTVPRLGQIPAGCAFAPRCPDRFEPCADLPALVPGPAGGQPVRCFLHHRVRDGAPAPGVTV
jgi:oligopeptide/dipeptide ABC transporter ATP-binding protein